MRKTIFTAIAVALAIILATADRGKSDSNYSLDRGLSSGGSTDLIAHVSSPAGQPQTVTIIDPRQRVLGVYHVDPKSGEVSLKSVRNFSWDLQMIEFNSTSPLPQDVRNGLDR
jgi:hypothetical protein